MLARSGDWLEGPYGYIPFTVSADFTFICNDAVVQYIQTLGMSTAELTFFRLLFTATVCATYLWFTDRAQLDLFRSELRLVWMRGIADVLGLMLVYQAFEYMPLSNAITVLQLRPFIVGFICMVILKEAFTWRQAVACGISIFAVALVVQPEFMWGHAGTRTPEHRDHQAIVGTALCIIGTILQSIGVMLLRQVGEADSVVIALIYGLSGCIVSPIFSVVFLQSIKTVNGEFLLLFLTITFGGLIAQLALVQGLKRAEGSKVACLGYAQVVWSVILQSSITKIFPSLLEFLGMTIIVGAGVWAVLSSTSKQVESEKEIRMREFEQEGLLEEDDDHREWEDRYQVV